LAPLGSDLNGRLLSVGEFVDSISVDPFGGSEYLSRSSASLAIQVSKGERMTIEFSERWCVSRQSVRTVYVDLSEFLASAETLTSVSVTLDSGPAVTTASEAVLVSAITPDSKEIAFGSDGSEIAIGEGVSFVATIPDESGEAVLEVEASSATQTIKRNCRIVIS